jgi:hypothetical protein
MKSALTGAMGPSAFNTTTGEARTTDGSRSDIARIPAERVRMSSFIYSI